MIVHDLVHVLLQEFTEDTNEGNWPIVSGIRQFITGALIDSFHWSGILPVWIERLNNLVIDGAILQHTAGDLVWTTGFRHLKILQKLDSIEWAGGMKS